MSNKDLFVGNDSEIKFRRRFRDHLPHRVEPVRYRTAPAPRNALSAWLPGRRSNGAARPPFSAIFRSVDIPAAASGEIPTRIGWCPPAKRLSSLH
ncbi:hypothetical protein [Burkholderia thailandensis]|uniref:hypothetical protein n=1 Tax=Burkholderia thailandensis TaxID=57975 RepID=UPI00107E6A1A|nr:hypothetical protein [Burkholderia thailandensis]MCZ2894617.1 hypothetical protein [Burkholderia thailandensis]MCZ2900847.1 hypothetical protein [Burkholderia thailandensis]MDD1480698.1 hypothetical protein [Burkholderia thailandensis]MDD1487755.1 hypothetical protein [Burkholderia thailandensis]MDD1493678.1 hypothetical protein [Burkholderia thailandensis]